MFKAALVVIFSLSVAGCVTSAPRTAEFDEYGCPIPIDPIAITEHALNAKASVYELEEIVDAEISYEAKAERIRSELEGVSSLEVWDYRMCVAFKDGRLTREEYREETVEIRKRLVLLGVPEKKNG